MAPEKKRYSIAPMMDYTDRYFRFMMRKLYPNAMFYTEMQVSSSIVFGEERRFLDFDEHERPLILQLASSNPEQLAQAVQRAEAYPYDGYNLNIGCPSEKAEQGGFGVCQMAKTDLVVQLCEAVRSVSQKALSVKHRIGIGTEARYEDLRAFAAKLYASGIRHFIVHARTALLGGYKPRQNRSIPPLRYADVYRLKTDFPDACIEINGGIRSLAETLEHLAHTDAVMIGRLAYQNPFLLHRIDRALAKLAQQNDLVSTFKHAPEFAVYYDQGYSPAEKELFLHTILEALKLAETHEAHGTRSWPILRHLLHFFAGCPGARIWRRSVASRNIQAIAEQAHRCIDSLQD